MFGLIKKDFLLLAKTSKTLLLLLLFMTLMQLPSANTAIITGTTTVLFGVLVITTFSYDDLAKWQGYELTLPIPRSQIVLSKYVSACVFTLIGVLISTSVNFVFYILDKTPSIQETLGTVGLTGCVVFMMVSIVIPLIFKYGAEKARLFMMLIFILPYFGITFLAKSNIIVNFDEFFNAILNLLPIITVSFIIVSYFISVRILNSKEI